MPPDAPGAAAPPEVASPPVPAEGPASPPPKGSDAAIAAARQRLQEGKPLVEAPEPVSEPAAPEAATGEQPPTEPTGEEAAPEEDVPEETAEEAPPEEPEQPSVTLRGLADRGEQDLELIVPDVETHDRINRLQNEAEVGRRVRDERQQLSRQRQQLDDVQDQIAVDPTGFVMQHLPDEHRVDIAMQLFLDPAVLTKVQEQLAAQENPLSLTDILDSPDNLRLMQAELRASRAELREQLRSRVEERKTLAANAQKVITELDKLIPETVTGVNRDRLFQDALRDIQDRAERLNLKQLDPQDVRLIVAARFREMGIAFRGTEEGGQPARPASGQPAAPKPGKTAQQFQQVKEAKRAAAATAPAGVGAPAARPRPDLPVSQKDGKDTERVIQVMRKEGIRKALGLS